jgi:hypothetical protein
MLIGMDTIRSVSNPLQVRDAIVPFVAIRMIDFSSQSSLAQECSGDQPVNLLMALLPIPTR